MEAVQKIPLSVVHEVRDQCLCFAVQRAARQLARRFDRAFQPLGITNGQYSLMVALVAKGAPRLGALAEFLAMDQTTVTAAVKALEGRGLVERRHDPDDQRARQVALTEAGHRIVAAAVPVWRAEIRALQDEFGADRAAVLIQLLRLLGVPSAAVTPAAQPDAPRPNDPWPSVP